MKCREFHDQLADLLDESIQSPEKQVLLEHSQACPRCARELEEARQTLAALKPAHTVQASTDFKERVMQTIRMEKMSERESARGRPGAWTRRLAWSAAVLAVFIALAGGYNWYAGRSGAPQVTAFSVMARAAEVMAGLKSFHMKMKWRTAPAENFAYTNPDLDFVPVELWVADGELRHWRAEKPERVIVNDGQSTLMWIHSTHNGTPVNMAAKAGAKGLGFIEWLAPFLEPDKLLDRELAAAKQEKSELTLIHEKLADGTAILMVTVEATAQGDYRQSDYGRNTSVEESENRRIYIFDEKTNRILGLNVYVKTDKGDVLVFEITDIDYDAQTDPSLFTLNLPADVSWFTAPQPGQDDAAIAQMTQDEFARAFFEACGKEDWAQVAKYFSVDPIPQHLKDALGGVQIISIGKPFKSGLYGGWFVPYEIKYRSGETRKMNLAVRNDNPAKRWMVDGGL